MIFNVLRPRLRGTPGFPSSTSAMSKTAAEPPETQRGSTGCSSGSLVPKPLCFRVLWLSNALHCDVSLVRH